MDEQDIWRGALTETFDEASSIPGVNIIAGPVATALHAMNEYAEGASWGQIAEDTLTEAAPQVALAGAGRLLKFAMGGPVASSGAREALALEENSGKGYYWADAKTSLTGKTAKARNAAIDSILNNELKDVPLTFKPHYSPTAQFGVAKRGVGTQIGPRSFESRSELGLLPKV
jgi:hypothetical protein